MASDRGQRRAELVRDRHQEVALELLGLLQPRGHLAEPRREMSDLVPAPHRRDIHVVPALRDLVRRFGQRLDRLRDAPAEVKAERRGDSEAHEPGEQQPLDQRRPSVPSSAVGLATTIAPRYGSRGPSRSGEDTARNSFRRPAA